MATEEARAVYLRRLGCRIDRALSGMDTTSKNDKTPSEVGVRIAWALELVPTRIFEDVIDRIEAGKIT